MTWRLAEGATLGGDLTPLFGPLSFRINALLWNLGGASLTPILIANLAVAALTAGCLFATARQVFRVSTSGLLVAVFLSTFAFAQLRPYGSFNFAIPYTHAATHGALFTCASLAFLVAFVRKPDTVRLIGGAVTAGTTWLLKPELAVATTVAVMTALLLVSPGPRRRYALATLTIVLPVVAYLLAATFVGAGTSAAESLLRPWIFALRAPSGAAGYYALVSGLDAPSRNLGVGLTLAASVLCSVAGLVVLDQGLRGVGSRVRAVTGLVALTATFGLLFATSAWLGLGPALPYLLVIVILALLRERRGQRARGESDDAPRVAALLVWAVLALVLLSRMMLRARLDHYGFYLAGPGLLLLLGILVEEIPRRVRKRRYTGGSVISLAGLGVAASVLVGSVRISEHWLARKTGSLGTGGDRIHVLGGEFDPRPGPVGEAIRLARTLSRPDESVLVIPEGGIINYLARRRSPVATSTLLPPEIAALGPEAILRQIRQDPPAVVFLSPLPLADYGDQAPGDTPAFGADFVCWIERRYSPMETLADRNRRGVKYELVVLLPSPFPRNR